MNRTWIGLVTLVGGLSLSVGCSAWGAASTGMNVFSNTRSNKLEVIVQLDGQQAKRNEAKQAATGYSKYKIATPVSTSPTFRYAARKDDSLGRISSTNISIYKKVGSKYSDQAEFVIFPRSNSADAAMQPDTDYNLASLPAGYGCQNWKGETVGGVTLEPGMDYMLVFSVRADDSETAQIYFTTN